MISLRRLDPLNASLKCALTLAYSPLVWAYALYWMNWGIALFTNQLFASLWNFKYMCIIWIFIHIFLVVGDNCFSRHVVSALTGWASGCRWRWALFQSTGDVWSRRSRRATGMAWMAPLNVSYILHPTCTLRKGSLKGWVHNSSATLNRLYLFGNNNNKF